MQLELSGNFKVQELELKFKPNRNHSQVTVTSPKNVWEFLAPRLADEPREKCIGLYFNPTNEVAALEVISQGTSDAAMVSPREVFKTAFLTNAPAIIIAHNHPSGNPNPSDNDKTVARVLKKAGKLLDINVLDFMIITHDRYYSFMESEPDFNIELKKGGE